MGGGKILEKCDYEKWRDSLLHKDHHVKLNTLKPHYSPKHALEMMKEKAGGKADLAYEVNINLNIDPKLPGHDLRGVFLLPHGSGKWSNVAALTSDPDLTISALAVGAKCAGDIAPMLVNGHVPLDCIHRVVITPEFREACCRKSNRLAKQLKMRKLTPNKTTRTVVDPEDFVDAVFKHASGKYFKFKPTTDGIITVNVGRVGIQTVDQAIENLQEVLRHLYAMQPRDFGTGPRAKRRNKHKYVLGIHVGVNSVGTVPLDLRKTLGDYQDVDPIYHDLEKKNPKQRAMLIQLEDADQYPMPMHPPEEPFRTKEDKIWDTYFDPNW
jgi:large subunit ribosomal protein L1